MNSTNPSTTNRPQPVNEPPTSTPAEAPAKKFDLSVTQTVGGALAAMTAAALGSRLGVAGTITGAAVASIIAGVAGTLYTASLRTTREKVKTVWTGRVAGANPNAAQTSRDPNATIVTVPGTPVWDSVDAVAAPPRVTAPVVPPKRLPWKGMVVAVLTMFVIAAAALTAFEALSGSALSGGKGTTFSQVTKEHKPATKSTKKAKASDSPSPTDSPSASKSPTSESTTQAPNDPATSAEAAPTSDQPSASEAPSEAPSQNASDKQGSGNSGSSRSSDEPTSGSSQDTPAG